MKIQLHFEDKDIGLIMHTMQTAAAAHGKQIRKYTNEPYWFHPVRVAATASATPGSTTEMVQAALLHDVLEDTEMTAVAIEQLYGPIVSGYVQLLTDEGGSALNRAARKARDRARLSRAPAEVQTIKVADLLDNTASIVGHDPNFAAVYMREKRALLEVVTHADHVLLQRAHTLVNAYFAAHPEKT